MSATRRPRADAHAARRRERLRRRRASRPDQRGLDFVRPDGTRTVFQAANVARIRRYDDTGKAALEESLVPNSAVSGAGLYAFGSFRSPSWLTKDRAIPATPTRTGAPKVTGSEEVGFTLIVPVRAPSPPAAGPSRSSAPASRARSTTSSSPPTATRSAGWRRSRSTRSATPSGRAARRRSTPSCRPRPSASPASAAAATSTATATITDQEGVRTPGAAESAGEHRPARRAAPDRARQHGARARDRPRRGRRRRRQPRTCAATASSTTPRAWAASTARC